MSSLSCGQLHILRKLALLRLTACMERYCPSHKSGWNWELPKLIRKIKSPDYKGNLNIMDYNNHECIKAFLEIDVGK